MGDEETATRIPVSGELLWTTKVDPSAEGSGALPPNPVFSEEAPQIQPSPEIEALLDAYSTPVDLDLLTGTFP